MIVKHPTKENIYVDEATGEEFTLFITGADAPISYGYLDETGFHEFVCKPDGEILKERHTPLSEW